MDGNEHRFETERVLANLAPELTPHVHSFLHGGGVGFLSPEFDYAAASIKLRSLHDALIEATHRRKMPDVAILSSAVRLQAVILYETLKRQFNYG